MEALSRGAASAILIDNALGAKQCITKNLKTFEATSANLLFGDVFQQLKKLQQRNLSFDLIYADPPYNKGLGQKLAEAIDQSDLLRTGGILFIEEGEELSLDLKTCILQNIRPYGRTILHQITRP